MIKAFFNREISVYTVMFTYLVLIVLSVVVHVKTAKGGDCLARNYVATNNYAVNYDTNTVFYDSYGKAFKQNSYGVTYWTPQYDRVAVRRYVSNTYVANINYPGQITPQGSARYGSYGYQQSTFKLLDPNTYFPAEMALIKSQQEGLQQRTQTINESVRSTLELQNPIAEKLATAQAAKMILDSAGLNTETTNTASSSAILIQKDEYGKVQVSRVDPNAVVDQQQQGNLPGPTVGGSNPKLSKFCGECHGPGRAETHNSHIELFDSNDSASVMREKFYTIKRKISSGAMPPPNALAQPSDSERQGVLDEVEGIIQSHSTGKE